MRKPTFSGGGTTRTALFGVAAFGALGLCVAAGAALLMAPSLSLGASQSTASPAAAATPAAATTDYQFAKELVANGVKGCAPVVETMSKSLIGGATSFASASNWDKDAPDARIVSILTGQKFGGGAVIPNGLAGVFASPHSDGKCDGISVQVLPSPLDCGKLRANIEKSGKMLGDLAGVPLLSSGGGQILLVPTTTNTCIVVGVQIAYAK